MALSVLRAPRNNWSWGEGAGVLCPALFELWLLKVFRVIFHKWFGSATAAGHMKSICALIYENKGTQTYKNSSFFFFFFEVV